MCALKESLREVKDESCLLNTVRVGSQEPGSCTPSFEGIADLEIKFVSSVCDDHLGKFVLDRMQSACGRSMIDHVKVFPATSERRTSVVSMQFDRSGMHIAFVSSYT